MNSQLFVDCANAAPQQQFEHIILGGTHWAISGEFSFRSHQTLLELKAYLNSMGLIESLLASERAKGRKKGVCFVILAILKRKKCSFSFLFKLSTYHASIISLHPP